MLPIRLDAATVERLFAMVERTPGFAVHIDLAAQTLTPDGAEPIGLCDRREPQAPAAATASTTSA